VLAAVSTDAEPTGSTLSPAGGRSVPGMRAAAPPARSPTLHWVGRRPAALTGDDTDRKRT